MIIVPRRKTDAEFKQQVYDLVGDEYTFLDVYTNSSTKIRVKHNKCGNIYEVTPNHFLRGIRCSYCSAKASGKARRKTDAQFKKEIFDLVGNEYTFLDPYQGVLTKIRVRHNKCNEIYEVTPAHFISGRRCPACHGNIKKTNAQFKKEVFDLVGDEYTFLDAYVNTRTKIRVKHNTCGNVYTVAPHDFLKGTRCPYCAGLAKKTNNDFKKEIFNLVGSEYTILEPYINAKTKIKVKHNKCGTIYKVRPYSFLEGYRCPYCNSPKGETIITKILDTLNIKYEYQKNFPNLRDAQPLSYDFYIPSQNILIEYQGLQHYQPIDYFGGKNAFDKQQKHDKLKSEYAKNHGYNLIAIPYTVDTFSKIKNYLIKHGLKN